MAFKPNRDAKNAITYTDEILTCDSCGKQYGFLIEVKSIGRYCALCFRSAFKDYFKGNPEADYCLIRGLLHSKGKKND